MKEKYVCVEQPDQVVRVDFLSLCTVRLEVRWAAGMRQIWIEVMEDDDVSTIRLDTCIELSERTTDEEVQS